MSCGCIYTIDDGVRIETLECKIRTANKKHCCTECYRTIMDGEKYEYIRGVFVGGKPESFKTCSECFALREEFFCHSFCVGFVLEDIKNYIQDTGGVIASDCLLRLPIAARNIMIDMLDEYFENADDGGLL